MAEALTESFCERCGTRYEFKAPTRLNPLRKTRGLVSGLKNYIMSQDALSDAVGDAMRSEEDSLAAAQLEAFHESFNFCINCRQYTCVSCWNDGAGRCRSCAPIAGTDDLAERMAHALHEQPASATIVLEQELSTDALQDRVGLEAWPTSDLEAGQATDSNGRAHIEWPAAELSPATSEPEQEPVVAEVEPEPEPVVAEVEPEPEPRRIRPISETILPLPAAPQRTSPEERVAAAADTPEIAARRAQLDLLGLEDPGEGAVQEQRRVVPYRSRGAAPSMTAGPSAAGSFWDASAREVAEALSQVGVQSCGGCGLSLSASARFCRRCGTRQARSA